MAHHRHYVCLGPSDNRHIGHNRRELREKRRVIRKRLKVRRVGENLPVDDHPAQVGSECKAFGARQAGGDTRRDLKAKAFIHRERSVDSARSSRSTTCMTRTPDPARERLACI